MKNIALPGIVILVFLISCEPFNRERGNGQITTEQRQVEDFEEIDIQGNFKIVLKKGSTVGLSVTADENLHQFISVSNRGETLMIDTEKSLSSKDGITLNITYKQISAVDVGGAGMIRCENVISGDYFRIDMSGAGDVELDVDLKALKVNVAGAGSVELKGKVNEQNISMSGAGGLDAYDLISQHCKIDISGVGGAKVNVRKSLDATVSGVGGISYRGNPKDVKSDVSGIGSIDREEEDGKE